MANRTDPSSKQIHGMNPQMLLETILRNKIYNTLYWKEKCFALNSETIIDRAMELQYIGSTYGGNKNPTEFICLILKMLQIQPGKDILEEYLSDAIADYKYLRALAAFYVRLTEKPVNVYKKLEPLFNDYRKLRVRTPENSYKVIHMDEFIEDLINKDSVFEVTLPALPKRRILEQNEEIEPRISLLEADLNLEEMFNRDKEGEDDEENNDGNADIFGDMDINIDNLDRIDKDESDNSSESEESVTRKRNRDNNNSNDQRRDDYDKINSKKRKTTDQDNNTNNKVVDYKQLDPNSDEYWIEMRKQLGIK